MSDKVEIHVHIHLSESGCGKCDSNDGMGLRRLQARGRRLQASDDKESRWHMHEGDDQGLTLFAGYL